MTPLNLKDVFNLWVEHYAKIVEEHKTLLPQNPVYYLASKT